MRPSRRRVRHFSKCGPEVGDLRPGYSAYYDRGTEEIRLSRLWRELWGGFRVPPFAAEDRFAGVRSEILNGERELNVRQVRAVAQRFHVSAAVFVQSDVNSVMRCPAKGRTARCMRRRALRVRKAG